MRISLYSQSSVEKRVGLSDLIASAAMDPVSPRLPPVTRRILAAQNISRMCLVCGRDNALGLQARFYELEGGELLGVFTLLPEHQSYPGRLHGGIAAAILDETIGRAIMLHHPDAWGVTIEFTTRYRRPVPLGGDATPADGPAAADPAAAGPTATTVRAIGRITRDTSRLFEGTGEILLPDGTVAVEGRGRYLRRPLDEIVDDDFLSSWFPDERERPDEVEL